MPLQVKNQPEPFTEFSKSEEPILAISAEYYRLRRDLERYTSGQIQGRSYLIAGHRGSGKTILVHKAVEDVFRSSLNKDRRPLMVRLHGPDLLPPLPVPEPVKVQNNEEGKEEKAEPEKAKEEKEKEKEEKDKVKKQPQGKKVASETATETPLSPTAPVVPETHEALNIVLTQMMKSLFRDVTNEYRRCYREAVLRRPLGLRRDELLEIASQFDLELNESLTPSRLRAYWQRIGAFKQGILFTSDRTKYKTYTASNTQPDVLWATDAGLQEILTLSLLSQAFQVISGTVEERQRLIDAAKDERSSTLNTAYALKNLFGPVAGLLTGAFVGVQISSTTNPIAAVLLGLLTGAVVSFGFTYTSKRSKSTEASLESVFIKDRSVATLSSILPLLVVRLKEIGLAPVFVIDELDKVEELRARMKDLIRHLKFLVTENAFSCFLTDRRYHTYLNTQAAQTPYAPEYTYFSDRLLVLYPPDELRNYVMKVLGLPGSIKSTSQDSAAEVAPPPSPEQAEGDIISYVLLHRSRLHPIDLRRQIDRLPANNPFSLSEVFRSQQYRFEMLMQLAIEWLLESPEVQSQIEGKPDSRQLVYDALYYVSRLWEDASESQTLPGFKDVAKKAGGKRAGSKKPAEKKPGFVLDKESFSKYLESRCSDETDAQSPSTEVAADALRQGKALGGLDFDFLFEKVSDLVSLLTRPGKFSEVIAKTKPAHIVNALPSQLLLQSIPSTNNYQWLYDFSGRYLETREKESVKRDVEEGLQFIPEQEKYLQTLGNEVNLQAMANLKVIPRTREWREVKLALDRLERLKSDDREYDAMSADRDCIVEFNGTLREFLPNIKAALICAAILAPEISANTVNKRGDKKGSHGTQLFASLFQVSQLLAFSASREDDLRKLDSVLRTALGTTPEITPRDDWDKVLKFINGFIEKRSPHNPDSISENAWAIFKNRFTQRFREGVEQFDPQFEDLFTSFKDIGPGRRLSFDLSTTTAGQWTSLLLNSQTDGSGPRVPEWMRVAAALELNLPDLAERLANSLGEDPLLQQWVRDFKLRSQAPLPSHRNVLVLNAETESLTSRWRASNRHASVVSTVADFGQLLEALKKNKISKPEDFPIDLVSIELPVADRATLGRLVTSKPSSVIAEMPSNKRSSTNKDLDLFLEIQDICYFGKETPTLPQSGQSMPLRFVLAPKGIDDLIDRLATSPSPTPPPG